MQFHPQLERHTIRIWRDVYLPLRPEDNPTKHPFTPLLQLRHRYTPFILVAHTIGVFYAEAIPLNEYPHFSAVPGLCLHTGRRDTRMKRCDMHDDAPALCAYCMNIWRPFRLQTSANQVNRPVNQARRSGSATGERIR